MEDSDFPALYVAADKKSLDGQTDFLRSTRARLALLILAAASGAFQWRFGSERTDWAAVVGAIAFAAAAAVEVRLLSTKPDRIWYDGRAVAESTKILAWRYMSGGRPFPLGEGPGGMDADELFLERLQEVDDEVRRAGLASPAGGPDQITEAMRKHRYSDFEARREFYRSSRIEDQRRWYADKATWNDKRATRWSWGLLSAEVAGIVAAVLRAVGVIELDALGLIAAAVAAAVAWVQTKQHVTLARAYAVASHELAAISSRIPGIASESAWAEFVDQSEEAISREHTMWRARTRNRRLRAAERLRWGTGWFLVTSAGHCALAIVAWDAARSTVFQDDCALVIGQKIGQ